MAQRPRRTTPSGRPISFDELEGADHGTEPDPWLRQVLSANLAEIERRIGTRLARSGGRIRRPLGCGAFGCVFLLEDGRVLKITHDDTEGAYSMFVRRMQEDNEQTTETSVLAVTARIDDVFRFQSKKRVDGHLQMIYGVVREQVGQSDHRLSEDLRMAAGLYTDGWDAYCSSAGDRPREFLGIQMARIALNRMKASNGYGKQIGAFLRFCWDRGMPLMDVHVANLARRIDPFGRGTRRGQIVLFDFGGSESYDLGESPCRFRTLSDYEAEVPVL